MAQRKQSYARFDNRRVKLRTGETQRDNGTYVFRWTGKDRKRHAVYAPTLEQLREKEEQIVVDRHDGIRVELKNRSINDMYELWLQMKTGIKDSTLKNYIFYYETYIKPTFGKKRLSDVRRSDVRLFYNRLKEDRCLKVSTIDNVHNVLYQVFQVAVEDDIIRGNPAAHMMKEFKLSHNIDTEKRRALTMDQQKLFLDFLKITPRYVHWYPVFYIMTNTGMRVGEITGLRWRDIDLDKGEISVNHTLVYYNHRDGKGCSFSVNTPKTAAGCRTIPMVGGVKEAFIMEREYQKDAAIESVARIEGYDDFIFVNKDGGVQHQGTLNKAIRRIIRDCNDDVLEKNGIENATVLLPHFSCHHLRHTFATRLCEAGLNIKVIQDILGHADVETTMNIYVDVTENLKKKETATFDAYMSAIEYPGESA